MVRPSLSTDYRQLVRDCVTDEQGFVRAIFSGRLRGPGAPWKRIVLRPILLAGKLLIQFTYYDAAKSIDRNLVGNPALHELAMILQMPFPAIHVEMIDRDIDIQIPSNGNTAIKSTAKKQAMPRMLTHDRQKHLPLPAGERDDYLVAVGIMGENGTVKADKQDKFRQVNEFLRLLSQTISLDQEQLKPTYAVDLGCGNAYLTFAAYHYLNDVLRQPTEMCGVDVREEPLVSHRRAAAQLGWDGLTFNTGTISEFEPPHRPDLVISLHACDTATDDAIARAIRWKSRYLLSVPCCHHDLQTQLRRRKDANCLKPVYRYGPLAERLGDLMTDTFRALILRMCGYRCDVVQFVSSEHTAKNLMIRAARAGRIGDPAIVGEYVALRDHLGVTPYLERLLSRELDDIVEAARIGT